MTGLEWVLLALALAFGFYAAWNIGANDVANAMGTSVGSRALTLKQAVILASIFEFLGAYLVGANVSETIRKKMFDPALLSQLYGDQAAHVLACGMIAALLAAGTWLLVASYFQLPVSTTHTIVGAVVGFGCIGVGAANVAWSKVGLITLGWVLSPVLSGAIAYIIFRFVLRVVFFRRDPVASAKRVVPQLVFLVVLVLTGVMVFKGLKPLWHRMHVNPFEPRILALSAGTAVLVGFAGMLVARRLLRRVDTSGPRQPNPLRIAEVSRSLGKAAVHLRRAGALADRQLQAELDELLKRISSSRKEARAVIRNGTDSGELRKVERIFVLLQVLTACFVAFAHGSNDVANAIGPLSAAFQAIVKGEVGLQSGVPKWALVLGGIGISIGLATWGWRVIETVGRRITELTPSRGFCAEFSAAITILLASILPIGLPVSTTHILVGAVVGVGLARGIGSVNLNTMRDIVASWVITIPAGAGLSIGAFYVLKSIFIK